MPKNEDGEFELILGNRQLLSVFFIVVVLLGVFFTMGYIVGRNSGPLQADVASSSHKEGKPMVIDPPQAKQEAKPESKTDEKPPEVKPQVVETRPMKGPEPESKKQEAAKKQEPAPEAPAASGGVYLQLTATSQHEAEVYLDVLKNKGFKAITQAVPEKPGLVRVMVGPLADNAVSKTRADLVAAGFPGDKAILKR